MVLREAADDNMDGNLGNEKILRKIETLILTIRTRHNKKRRLREFDTNKTY